MIAWEKKDTQKKRLYLLAKRKGLALQLCRKSEGPDYDTFRILNRTSSAVVHSASPDGYGLTLDQVAEYLTHYQAKAQAGTKLTVIPPTTMDDIRPILKSSKAASSDERMGRFRLRKSA